MTAFIKPFLKKKKRLANFCNVNPSTKKCKEKKTLDFEILTV